MAVVRHFNSLQPAELVGVKDDVNAVGISVDCVPYQLGHCENRLADLGNPLKVIVLDLNLKGLAGHGSSILRVV